MSNSTFFALVMFVVPALLLFILGGGLSLPKNSEDSNAEGDVDDFARTKVQEKSYSREPVNSA